jgi:hypothetical protein
MQPRPRNLAPRLFSLPGIVNAGILRSVGRQIARSPEATAWVLDFSATMHIDFRAMRDFAGQLRKAGRRDILLSGLNRYCEEIVHFALNTGDWDLFLDGESPLESQPTVPAALRGNSAASELRTGRGPRWRAWEEASDSFFPPCPN